MPSVSVPDRPFFTVNIELIPGENISIRNGHPLWLDDFLAGAGRTILPEPIEENTAVDKKTSSSRFGISFSRLATGELSGEGIRSFHQKDNISLFIESLHSVFRGYSDRNTLESIGGALAPQLNLDVKF